MSKMRASDGAGRRSAAVQGSHLAARAKGAGFHPWRRAEHHRRVSGLQRVPRGLSSLLGFRGMRRCCGYRDRT